MDGAWVHDAGEMARVAAGDEAAFARLYRAHAGAVFRTAYGVLDDREAARDVVQDAFLKLWQHAPRWEPRAQVTTWLVRVALNSCFSWRRRLTRALKRSSVEEPRAPVEGPFDHAARGIARDVVRRALAELSPSDRAIVVLHLDAEMQPQEIAPLVGKTDNATRVALHRALERLKAHASPKEAA